MPQTSKVELYVAIRRDHRGDTSMWELERRHCVTWRTVRKALDSSWPEPRKNLPPRATTLDPYKPVIDEILRADLDAPRRQRRWVTRILHRLVEEHGAEFSYGVARYYVTSQSPEILVEFWSASPAPGVHAAAEQRTSQAGGQAAHGIQTAARAGEVERVTSAPWLCAPSAAGYRARVGRRPRQVAVAGCRCAQGAESGGECETAVSLHQPAHGDLNNYCRAPALVRQPTSVTNAATAPATVET